jgi:hypothetical protein
MWPAINALINGAALALFALISGLIGLIARSVTYRLAMLVGQPCRR